MLVKAFEATGHDFDQEETVMSINDLLASGAIIQGRVKVVSVQDAQPYNVTHYEGEHVEWAVEVEGQWADLPISYIYSVEPGITVFEVESK